MFAIKPERTPGLTAGGQKVRNFKANDLCYGKIRDNNYAIAAGKLPPNGPQGMSSDRRAIGRSSGSGSRPLR